MKKVSLTAVVVFLFLNWGFAQNQTEIDALITEIGKTEDSRNIAKTQPAQKVLSFGAGSLPILAELFTDSTLTNVHSECQKRNLTKGEIAIVLADQIEIMPYATITGMQNCLGTFCENNLNLIEYYLPAIREMGMEEFQRKYVDWLGSDERAAWRPSIDNKPEKENRQKKKNIGNKR